MKNIILTITIICLNFIVFAQQHIHSPNLDKFVGTWVYKKDGKEVEIILRITTVKINAHDVTMDELEGFHVYKSDERTVDDSKVRNKTSLTAGLVQDRVDPNLVKFVYFDELKQKTGDATITFLPGNPNKISWHLTNTEGPKIQFKGKPKFDRSFTIPESVILEKKD